jgi:NarL family two-component system sensor histidine kinase YdfH
MKNKRHMEHPGLVGRRSVSEPSNLREVIPFFVVVSVVVVGLTYTALTGLGELRSPWRVGVVIFVMAVYLGLYWGLLLLPEKHSTYVTFLIIQVAIAFIFTLLTHQVTLSIGLYAPLVGVAVGSLRNLRWKTLAVAGIVLSAILTAFLVPDSNLPAGWFWVVIPITLFVIIYVELYSRQTEAREETQKLLQELEITHRQLTEYATQVEDLTLANERQRLARELHDTLAQGLVGLTLQLEAASSHLENHNIERAEEIIRQAMTRSRATLSDARRAIGDLREMQVLPDNLDEVIRDEAQRFNRATGIPCTVEMAHVDSVPDSISEHAQRIVSEALMNIAHHAQAGQVRISLSRDEEGMTISIRDDGTGFDMSEQTGAEGHYGLLGMRERARLAGGTLLINSEPGKGTDVVLKLPVVVSDDGV